MSIHWGGRGAGHISRWSTAVVAAVTKIIYDRFNSTILDRAGQTIETR